MANPRSSNDTQPTTTQPLLTPEEQKGLQDYWGVYEAHRSEIRAELIKRAQERPEFGAILQSEVPAQTAEQQSQSIEIQRRAIQDGAWEPYLNSLQAQGSQYAQAGLSFHAWFEIVSDFRSIMRPYLLAAYRASSEQLLSALDGVDKFIEITLGTIGDSYLDVKQKLIREQEATILDAQERRRLDARFRGLLEGAPDAMVIVDENSRILLVNSQTEKLFGYRREELLGQIVNSLLPERYRAVHAVHRAHYFSAPRIRSMGQGLDLYALRKDGSEFPVEISLSPLETETGTLVTAAIRDVAERKQIEAEIHELNRALERRAAELEVANRELKSFSYSVSHDLRAPLRTIDGFSQALLEDYGNQLPADARNFLEHVRGAAQRMAKLIDDLLELSRISRIPMERKTIDVTALAEDIADELR